RRLVVGAEAEERHVARAVLLDQVIQERCVAVGNRALERKEDHDHGLLVLEVMQADGLAGCVLESEVVDLLVELGVGTGVLSTNAGGGKEDGGNESEKEPRESHASVLDR